MSSTMDKLINDLRKFIEPVHTLVSEAASYMEPEINAILNKRITDKYEIEKALDSLLNYIGMSRKADELFKRLCNYSFFMHPEMVSSYIVFYLEMYTDDYIICSDMYDEEGFYINSIDVIKGAKYAMENVPMTIITGDAHGDFSHIEAMCVLSGTTKDDLLIILGDVGINYYGGKKEKQFKHLLSELPITMLCIHGNHERRPETIVHTMKYPGVVE
jgi:hypothetical protein